MSFEEFNRFCNNPFPFTPLRYVYTLLMCLCMAMAFLVILFLYFKLKYFFSSICLFVDSVGFELACLIDKKSIFNCGMLIVRKAYPIYKAK